MITYIIVIILIIVIVIMFKMEKHKVKYVKSSVNNVSYLVRDRHDSQQAADILGQIDNNIKDFIQFLKDNKNDDKSKDYVQYIDQLDQRIKNVVISESSANSSYTSYSVNKGEELVFCLRSKYTNNFHDINLLMYVVLHELSHIGCPEYGHGPLFKKIFAFFAMRGIDCKVYEKVNFGILPTEYCGLIIGESII